MPDTLPGIKQFDLTGKAAIITGGSKGLGLAMAAGLASAGASVMLVSRNASKTADTARELADTYGTMTATFDADVTNGDDTEAMATAAMDEFGRIDILINSAGINIRGAIDELTLDQFNEVLAVNVNGTWLASKAVTPYMKKSGAGSIINIASTLGLGRCCESNAVCIE